MDPEIIAALKEGIQLFNDKKFFEAHEIWEEKWIDTVADERHLLQGLIQVAAGFYKLQVGMPQGTFKLLEKATGHLRAIPTNYYGVDLESLLKSVDQWQQTSRAMIEEFRTDYDKTRLPSLTMQSH